MLAHTAMYDLILKNGNVLIRNNDTPTPSSVDVGVINGKIAAIGELAEPGKRVIDATGLHILPGLIDSQVHFREPGHVYKEDLESGTRGAVQGGITAIFDMPNTKPSTDSVQALNDKLEAAKNRAWCNYAFYMGATANNRHELKDLENLQGCCGIKIFMGSSTGDLLVEEDTLLEEIFASTKRTIALHCEDEERLKERKHIAEKEKNPLAHPVWRDEISALKATQRVIAICKKLDRRVHVLHVTTKQEMELLKQNKKYTSVECTPQHLTLFAPDCYEKLGTYAQMNPPVRTADHKEALWKGLTENVVDVLGSDHAPHTKEEKEKQYPNSPSGMTGVQTTLPLMLNHVKEGRLTLARLVDLLSYNPSQLFKIKNKGQIAVGFDADFTIVDLEKNQTITHDWIESKSGWTPFHGKKVTGWPTHTIIGGQVVMENGKISKPAGKPLEFSDL